MFFIPNTHKHIYMEIPHIESAGLKIYWKLTNRAWAEWEADTGLKRSTLSKTELTTEQECKLILYAVKAGHRLLGQPSPIKDIDHLYNLDESDDIISNINEANEEMQKKQ